MTDVFYSCMTQDVTELEEWMNEKDNEKLERYIENFPRERD